ncbi:MAG TPA: CoA-binding protein [Chitinophagales bacterium]|nr:CoA-binding protein [Chitinophagales bacterium]HMU68361.1 CoA-binding protein [Chitinophagales bacterium]HMZ89665.1 CoA-binding protein [Chitinophagales bacterium]HNE46681.1 CoA-binding protein [Chitinophagales bacterium]HNF69617.1 CoA-binding protein [Chitinophagales bacterium]
MHKRTLVLGASENPERYANKAVRRLNAAGHDVVAFGKTGDHIGDTKIEREWLPWEDIDTVTLYLNPVHQEAYYDKIIALAPKRIIFNPGTENDAFEALAHKHGIETLEACTLVLLSIGEY